MNEIEYTENIFFCYTCPIISLNGLVLSLFCLSVLMNSEFKQNFYNFLKIEIFFITLNFIIGTLKPLFHCYYSPTRGKYYSVIYFIYFINYLSSVLEQSVYLCNILSTVEFYLLISNKQQSKFNILKMINSKLIGLFVFISSLILFLYQTFEFDIRSYKIYQPPFYNLSSTTDFFTIEKSKFSFTNFFRVNKIAGFVMRDFINLLILIFLNILIYLNIRKSIRRKLEIQSNVSTSAKNVDNSLKLMVFLGSLNNIIGRIPIAIWSILDSVYSYEKTHLLLKIAVLFVNLSFSFHFILYFITNKLFRKVFLNYLSYISNRKLL
jgi:hypothetical protein